MQYKENIGILNRFVVKLQDVESEKLFDARFSYFVQRDKDAFYAQLDEILMMRKQPLTCGWLEQYYNRNPQNREKRIVIFGAGEMGRLSCRTLLLANRIIDCICDNNQKMDGLEYQGIPIRNAAYVYQHFRDDLVIIAVSVKYQIEIYHQLIAAGFQETNILMSAYGGGGI